jgi:hypothetical protein
LILLANPTARCFAGINSALQAHASLPAIEREVRQLDQPLCAQLKRESTRARFSIHR